MSQAGDEKLNRTRFSDATWWVFALSAVIAFSATIGYVSATSFKSGYLSHFGVDIRLVDYFPSVSDLVEGALFILAAVVISGVLLVVSVGLMNGFLWMLRKIALKFKLGSVARFANETMFSRRAFAVLIIACALFFVLKISFHDSHGRGVNAAKAKASFTAIQSPEEGGDRKVLIYQSGGQGFFKTYSVAGQRFYDSYEVRDVVGESFELIDVRSLGKK